MAPNKKNTAPWSQASALLMLLTLLWLTVCTPFVYASQQQVAAAQSGKKVKTGQAANPLAGTTEEKAENGVASLSEYLHETTLPTQHATVQVKFEKCHPSNLYLAFHPDLHCPPPNIGG